ncbi:acylphosphatase [Hahella ganghwensis]|uniref:acylphosphatase n=1 Tax=Hahella ganghwensis TaxID=286420 RepID=UPI00036BA796|nr:acylphosphatase [Hahella ganghwensis]
MTERKSIHAVISGKVQGVWFRQSTKQTAQALGISGSAVNLSDGRVEVHAHGTPEAIEKLIEWLHEGPEQAIVNEVLISEYSGNDNTPEGFTTG